MNGINWNFSWLTKQFVINDYDDEKAFLGFKMSCTIRDKFHKVEFAQPLHISLIGRSLFFVGKRKLNILIS